MSFWTWALDAYARPDAAPACLHLQDNHGQCAPYLLWAAWAAADGRSLPPEVIKRGAALAHRWEQAAVGPLRRARIELKTAIDGIADDARDAIRAEVKTLELKAEQTVMAALEALAPEAAGPPLPLQPALAAAAAAWRVPAPVSALGRLAKALG
jgi:uncharacterized protein (TIGR02444 family)